MARQESDVFDGLPHVKIAKLAVAGYGLSALCERYYWASAGTVGDAVVYGRGILRRDAGLPPQRPADRITTVEQEEAIMAAAVEAGGIGGIGRRFGVSLNFVMTLFWERGLDYPRKDDAARGRTIQATYDARRMAKGFPAITEDSLRADLAAGMLPAAMAAKYGMGEDTLRRRAQSLRLVVGVPPLDRAAALRAYESGESVRSIAERTGKTASYVRKVLDRLGAFEPEQPTAASLPKVRVRGRLLTADLRADLNVRLTVRQIAERHGVSTSSVRTMMSRLGWKATRTTRLDRRMPARPELIARKAAGERVRDLAREAGVTPGAICNEIAKARRASA